MNKHLLVLLAGLSVTSLAFGLTLFVPVASPGGCPENLSITTHPVDGDPDSLLVIAALTPQEPEPYKGRVVATGKLTVKVKDEFVVESRLKSTVKKGTHTFRFKLARGAFEDSRLVLSTHLYEKDGLATVGGGTVFEVALGGFLP